MENKRPRTSFFKRASDDESQSQEINQEKGGSNEGSSERSSESRLDRSEYRDEEGSDERPRRAEGFSKPRYDRGERSDRPERSDRGERRDYGDKPRREGGYAKKFGDRKEGRKDYGDKPRREGGFGDRKFGEKREGGYGDRKFGERREGGFGDRKFGDKREGGFGDRKFGDRREGGFGDNKKSDNGYNRYEPEPLQAPENMIFGIHPVREALEAGQPFEKIYVKKDTEAAEGIIDYAEAKGIPVQYVPIEKLDKLTRRNNHQGVVAVIPAIEYADFNQILEDVMALDKPATFVVLDSITDVRNFGAIARTAECIGADAIIIGAKSAAPINSEAMKTSAGALATIPVCRVGSLRNTLKTMQLKGIELVAATEKSTTLLYETKLDGNIAIVMGSEDTGISVDVLRICDHKIAIPLLGKIESLNVSAAAAVLMYEVVRQRFEKM